MSLFTDPVQSTLERALDGVSLRQRVAAQNVANAVTPGYQAQQVSFESALSDALANGTDPSATALSVTPTGAPSAENGNNVDLTSETTGLVKDGLQYDALAQATSYRLDVLRDALKS